jgi:hypothetical protein
MFNRVFISSRLVSDFDSRVVSDLWSRVLWASVPARNPAQPGLARPETPLAPLPPLCAPLLSPFPSLNFPAQQLPLLHLSLLPLVP